MGFICFSFKSVGSMSATDRRKFLEKISNTVGVASLGLTVPGLSNARSLRERPGDFPAFPQGVASGHPSRFGFIAWTRIEPSFITDQPFKLQVSQEPDFLNPEKTILIPPERITHCFDYTLQVDLSDQLSKEGVWYYRFQHGEHSSRVGRARTLPTSSKSLQFAVFSCQDYCNGYYHAYKDLVEKDAVDYVLHLGDYIYERVKTPKSEGYLADRHLTLPSGKTLAHTLEDYRYLYKSYRQDPYFQDALAMYTWIQIWDDHEIVNDCGWDYDQDTLWAPGHPLAKDTSVSQKVRNQNLFELSLNAQHAYAEYTPTPIEPGNWDHPHKMPALYRKYDFGDLMRLVTVDGRSFKSPNGCSKTKSPGNLFRPPCIKQFAEMPGNPTLLGRIQKEWLLQSLLESSARWRVMASPFLFVEIGWRLPFSRGIQAKHYLNQDAWDGYAGEREDILRPLAQAACDNLLVLSGDMHSAVFSKIRGSFDPASPYHKKWLGHEILTPAISSSNGRKKLEEKARTRRKGEAKIPPLENLISKTLNPHLNFVNLSANGYTHLTLSRTGIRLQIFGVHRIVDTSPWTVLLRNIVLPR